MRAMKFEFSSGGVIYKSIGEKIFWLITRSSPSKIYPRAYWRLPKGWVDDEGDKPGPITRGEKKANEEILRKAALREVREEAGAEARVVRKIGTQKIFFTKEGERYIKFVTFFLMEWKKDLPEGFGFETSGVGWFSLEKAKEKLKHKSERQVLDKANHILSSDRQESLL
jgi:8-oxo-dGTP pyrophosphatase MutT (NUDIX family)